MVIQLNDDGKLYIFLTYKNGACTYFLDEYQEVLINPAIKKNLVFRLRKRLYENNIEIINNYYIDIGCVNEIRDNVIIWNCDEEVNSRLFYLMDSIYNDLIDKNLFLYHDKEGNLYGITYNKNNLILSIHRQVSCIIITIKEIIHKNKNWIGDI